MSDYVEVGKILEFLDAETNALNSTFGEIDGEAGAYVACFKNVRSYIERFPTADVEPVVHGNWRSNGIPDSMLSACSVCGFGCGAYSFRYCPNCGAKMDEEDIHE